MSRFNDDWETQGQEDQEMREARTFFDLSRHFRVLDGPELYSELITAIERIALLAQEDVSAGRSLWFVVVLHYWRLPRSQRSEVISLLDAKMPIDHQSRCIVFNAESYRRTKK
jgi:hypothetical protein